GVGFRKIRRDWADAQFAALDQDQSGSLDGDERARFEALFPPSSAPAPLQPADTDPADGKISPTESRRYILAATETPFTIQTLNSGDQSVNLIPKLDENRDGKLSKSEIEAAASNLKRYDRNEDDVVTVSELQQTLPEEI